MPYIEHWSAQADSVKVLTSKTLLNLSPESLQEARLVRDFARHVDDILVFLNDILMPRKLEAHLDNGFQPVREALRRRMAGESAGKPSGSISGP